MMRMRRSSGGAPRRRPDGAVTGRGPENLNDATAGLHSATHRSRSVPHAGRPSTYAHPDCRGTPATRYGTGERRRGLIQRHDQADPRAGETTRTEKQPIL